MVKTPGPIWLSNYRFPTLEKAVYIQLRIRFRIPRTAKMDDVNKRGSNNRNLRRVLVMGGCEAPNEAKGIDDLAIALSPRLICHFLRHRGTGSHSSLERLIHVAAVQVEDNGSAVQCPRTMHTAIDKQRIEGTSATNSSEIGFLESLHSFDVSCCTDSICIKDFSHHCQHIE